MVAKRANGVAMRTVKEMLKEERRINSHCELRSQCVFSVVEECSPREIERSNCGDESYKLSI